MAVPDYQSLMYPVLEEHADGRELPLKDMRAGVAARLRLSKEDLEDMLPSGQLTRYTDRANWAYTYLKQAGMLRLVRRGVYQITERGKQALLDSNGRIDNNYLKRFPEFVDFINRQSRPVQPAAAEQTSAAASVEEPNELTPDEMVRQGYRRVRAGVASELLDRLRRSSPAFFERSVVGLLVAMGYGGSREDAASVIGQTGDEGIDGIIKEDRLGLESIYIQAKRWKEGSTVGRPDIQQFTGALQGQKARKGVFITTSSFSREARDYAAKVQATIVLIDGQQMAELMLDHGVGVSVQETIRLFKIDEDYFIEE